ncbi:MAG: DUF1214 domain-containing protein [Deltaproteobacteria bacterium]|nr:DUF1214 domain-containing protein [Deltaproteobacteria bacterium]MBW2419539.1 DUF1214 domain-containing protein [Deltaproteobacteria bacterium]
MANAPEQRILDGSSWREFCRALERAGDVILRDASPMDPFDRAEGFRYLSRLTRVALESYIEFADPLAPAFRRPSHETVKIGADNPDIHYQSAAISGNHEYVIRGVRNTVHYLGFGTYVGSYGSGGAMGQSGYLEAADLDIDADGRFEIRVSCEEQPGRNWLPMQPETASLIVRQTYQDRKSERIADLEIERVGGEERPRPITAAFVDQGLAAAATYVNGTAALFADWAEAFAKHPNELRPLDPAVAAAAHGDPNIFYYHGYWELQPGEALLVEVKPPACDYWNFQVNNYWMESLDYRFHHIDVNHHGARYEDDGSLKIVLAERDPGFGNWLETAGHRRGTMCLRWIRAEAHPQPESGVISP